MDKKDHQKTFKLIEQYENQLEHDRKELKRLMDNHRVDGRKNKFWIRLHALSVELNELQTSASIVRLNFEENKTVSKRLRAQLPPSKSKIITCCT